MNIRARTFAITALVAGSIAGSAVAQDTVTIPLATWGGSEHVGVRQFVPAFEEALKEEAPERVEFQHFPGGQTKKFSNYFLAILPVSAGHETSIKWKRK